VLVDPNVCLKDILHIFLTATIPGIASSPVANKYLAFSMVKLTVTNVSSIKVGLRRSIEYPGFVLQACGLEPGETSSIESEPVVVKYKHTDTHNYDIYFYRLEGKNKYLYVCDFNPDFPSQRSLICEGRYSGMPTTVIMNVGVCPYAFRTSPSYPGTKMSGFLERGESATVFSNFRLIPFVHKDGHVYYIHFYKLSDNSGWVPDFDPDHPNKRTMHDKCGFFLSEVRELATTLGLKELMHDEEKGVVSFGVPAERAKVLVYYTTGTVVTSMFHPRQGKTQLFRRNQTFEGLRDILLNPCIYDSIGYTDHGRQRRGPNGPILRKSSTGVTPEKEKEASNEVLDEEEAIQQQIKRIDLEAELMEKERQKLLQALDSFAKHRTAEQRRQHDRNRRLEQQNNAMSVAERQAARGTEMVCYCANLAFVRKYFEPGVHCVAFGTGCELLLHDDGAMSCSNPECLPPLLLASLTARSVKNRSSASAPPPPQYVALGSGGRYYVSFGASTEAGTGAGDGSIAEREFIGSSDFETELNLLAARSRTARPPRVKRVAFGESEASWIILFEDGSCRWGNIPPRMRDCLLLPGHNKRQHQHAEGETEGPTITSTSTSTTAATQAEVTSTTNIEEVAMGPSGEWFVLHMNQPKGHWESNSTRFNTAAKAIKTKITFMAFGSGLSFFIRHK
jgi:hypothetical protein